MINLYDNFDWRTSQSGNKTCEWNFLNATIFPHGAGFKYVVNVDGAERADASFSKQLPSEPDAIRAAETLMHRLAEEAQSRRR